MHRGDNGACIIILPLPKSDCRSACFGFAGGTHIDTLKLDAPAIMGFHVESADDHHHSLPRVPASCADGMHRGADGACTIILPLPKSDCRSACHGFTGGTHIDFLLLDAPAIMGFRIERHAVKFANYERAVTIATALGARWLRHNAVF
ncbi:hypothetical protein MRX96_033998 [Rhipicephalus microplus]